NTYPSTSFQLHSTLLLLTATSTTQIYTLSLHDALPIFPGYFEGTQDTAYQRLERRFGRAARRTASGVFLLTRTLADCVRIFATRSEEHTSELQSRFDLVCRLLLEKKKKKQKQ